VRDAYKARHVCCSEIAMRRLLIALLVLLLLLGAGHYVLWRRAEARLASGYAAWVTTMRAQGWAVNAGKPSAGGWPMAATLSVPDMFISGGREEIPGGLTWSADRVVFSLPLMRPHALLIEGEGAQRLRLGELPDIPYAADRLSVMVHLDPGAPPRALTVRAVNLRAGLPLGPQSGDGPLAGASAFTAARLDLAAHWMPAAQKDEPALSVALRLNSVGLPPGRTWPLGNRMEALSLDAVLNGPLPRDPLLAERAATWRDNGGTLQIQRLAADWGPMQLTCAATLALDDALQPMGTGNAHIVNAAQTLDVLAGNGAIRPQAAMAAKALLALLPPGTANADSGDASSDAAGAEVDLPLTLTVRTLALGRIPLIRMPELVWAAAPAPASVPAPALAPP
jgi:hypothetical protein